MARIRTIKPEFPQSESMGRVSRNARLTFVNLWTISDDAGRVRGNSRMLASLLFPYDDDAPTLIEGWLSELEREGCIRRYVVDGSTYLECLNWLKHQKIDKPSASKLPSFVDDSRLVANPREEEATDLGPRTVDQDQKEAASPHPLIPDSEIDQTQDAVDLWNETAKRHGLPAVQKLTDARKAKLRNRMKDCGGINGWKAALAKISANAWMHGDNDRGWKVDFDFLVTESKFVKLTEGGYDRHGPAASPDEFRAIRERVWGEPPGAADLAAKVAERTAPSADNEAPARRPRAETDAGAPLPRQDAHAQVESESQSGKWSLADVGITPQGPTPEQSGTISRETPAEADDPFDVPGFLRRGPGSLAAAEAMRTEPPVPSEADYGAEPMSTHAVNVIEIAAVLPHTNAERLEIVPVNGWQAVVKKGQFAPGDRAIYIEPDYTVPTARPEFAFLAKEGRDRHRLKAVRLRGALSFGLLIPVPADLKDRAPGENVMVDLGIERYEPPVKLARSDELPEVEWPQVYSSKFDVENLKKFPAILQPGEPVIVTEKIHGANARYLSAGGIFYIGSRSNWLKPDVGHPWKRAAETDPRIQAWCEAHPDVVLYGEIYGAVQSLKYGTKQGEVRFAAFAALSAGEWQDTEGLIADETLPTVPVVYRGPYDIDAIAAVAELDSTVSGAEPGHMREGVVIVPERERRNDDIGRVALKLVSNRYWESAEP